MDRIAMMHTIELLVQQPENTRYARTKKNLTEKYFGMLLRVSTTKNNCQWKHKLEKKPSLECTQIATLERK